MFVYQIYNLRVASEFAIPTAMESCSVEKIRPDVQIYLDLLEESYVSLMEFRKRTEKSDLSKRNLEKLSDEDAEVTAIVQRCTDDGKEIYIDGIGFFLVSNGDCIRCRFFTDDIYRRDQWLLNYIFTVLASQRKEIILHGSAILPKGHRGMILITGDSGSGKSTLTDALLADGAGFASDDSVLFRLFGEEGVMGYGAYPLRRLMENALGERSREDLIFVPDGKKMKYGILERENFRQGPHRLEAVWILRKGEVPDVSISELKGVDKLEKLFTCIYNASCYQEHGLPPWMMETMLAIASVPVYVVTRPEGKDTLRQIRDAVTAKLEEADNTETEVEEKKSGHEMPENGKEERKTPEISLIVPVYNMEKWLPDFFEGLDAQTCESLEIIFVDDGSTDKSGMLLEEYRSRCRGKTGWTVRILRQENRGVSAARNAGIEAANGGWLAFADPDDWLAADYLSEMHAMTEREDIDVVICHERAVEENVHPSDVAAGNDAVPESELLRIEDKPVLMRHFQDDFPGLVTWSCNKLYRRELIGDKRFSGLRAMEDVIFNADVLSGATRAAWIGRRLYCYRQRKDSVCHRREAFYYDDYRTALREQNRIMEKLRDEQLFERDLAFCLGNLARLETEAELLGYREVAETLGREYIGFYEKAKGRLRGKAVLKAMCYRYMKRVYKMYITGKVRNQLRENGEDSDERRSERRKLQNSSD